MPTQLLAVKLVLMVLLVLATIHGVFLVWLGPGKTWKNTVFWYRFSVWLSWSVVAAVAILFLFAWSARGMPFNYPLTKNLYDFYCQYPYISGTVLVTFLVSLAAVLLELMYVDPLQLGSQRPIAIWLVWFLITFAASLLIDFVTPNAKGKSNTNDSNLTTTNGQETSARPQEKSSASGNENGQNKDSELKEQPGASGSKDNDPKIAFSLFAGVVVAGVYWTWTTTLLYRRVTEVDRLVGNTARRLVLFPANKHPAQTIVIGPRGSGKSELLRCLEPSVMPYPDNTQGSARSTTTQPVSLRFKRDEYDVSIIDTGGEFLGDSFELIRNLRTDCLVIVVCAAHLNQPPYDDNWHLSRVHKLFDLKHGSDKTIGSGAADYFRALNFATSRAGQQNTNSHVKLDPVSEVHRVLVVLNNADSFDKAPRAFDEVPLNALEMLAKSILDRFPNGNSNQHVAAMKVKLTVNALPANRNCEIVMRSVNLTSQGGIPLSKEAIFAGNWPHDDVQPNFWAQFKGWLNRLRKRSESKSTQSSAGNDHVTAEK